MANMNAVGLESGCKGEELVRQERAGGRDENKNGPTIFFVI
jgi:hypothetical protein